MYRILDVMYVDDLVFWSCPQCMYKMNEIVSTSVSKGQTKKESQLFCGKCQEAHVQSTIRRKYKLSMKVCDLSSRRIGQLTVFGKSLETVIGCDADEYHRFAMKQSADFHTFGRKIKLLLLRALLCKDVTLKVNNIQSVTSCRPVIKGHSLNVIGLSNELTLIRQLTIADRSSTEGVSRESDQNAAANLADQQETCKELKVEETWQQSLIAEFNQSLTLETPTPAAIPKTLLTSKRCRDHLSLSTTPSAPARTKARVDDDIKNVQNSGQQVFCPFMSPLLLPADFCTPSQQCRLDLSTSRLCSTEALLTSTPRMKIQNTQLADPSRDLFGDSELSELETLQSET